MDLRRAIDLQDVAWLFGCTAKQLGYYLYKVPLAAQYTSFEIKKRRGGTRTIHAPRSNIKLIQKNIARELGKLKTFKPCVNGFVTGRSIISNARPHVGQRFVLNVDLEDFFGSINFGRIYGMLTSDPYKFNKPVAAAIAKACTLDNKIPQGAPSSPVVSNLICSKLDAELSRLARAHGCIYTRYADDLTFSSSRRISLAQRVRDPDGRVSTQLSPTLISIIENNGFRINAKKIRLSETQHRHEVTGLIVNKKVNVKRRLIREVRAMLHAWRKFGLANAQNAFKNIRHGSTINFESAVRGKISFIGHVRGRHDEAFRRLAKQFNALAIGPKIRIELNPQEAAERAVWVIEQDGGMNQGTAFFVENFGLVTCYHCIEDDNEQISKTLYIYHPSDPASRHPVTVIAGSKHIDLAILSIPTNLPSIIPLKLSNGTPPAKGEAIQLFGYPAHHAARPIRIESGTVIRSFPRSAVNYIEVSAKIIGGNSGGPVLNGYLEVVGVAVLGLNGEIEIKSGEFLAVSRIHLNSLPTI